MNIIYLILFCVLGYGTLILGSLKWKKSILYTIAIGSIVNANIFHSLNYPINIFGLTFGMNSVIYVMFLFSILIMYVDFGKKEAFTLIICSIGGIIFASVVQFLTCVASNGLNIAYLQDMLAYFASCISSFTAGALLIFIFDKLKTHTNIYINFLLCLIIASIIDSLIYYGITFCLKISLLTSEFWLSLGTLYLGKLISIVFAIITLFFLTKFCNTNKNNENN